MDVSSTKEINRLRKETNRLLGKGMSNIYLKLVSAIFIKFLSFHQMMALPKL